MGALDTYFAGKEGTKVVVRYMGRSADKTATVVEDFGRESLQGGEEHRDARRSRRPQPYRSRPRAALRETYKLGSEAVVETDRGVVRGTRYLAKEGDKVAVHYTEAGRHEDRVAFSGSEINRRCRTQPSSLLRPAFLTRASGEFPGAQFLRDAYVVESFAGNLFDRGLRDG